MHTKVKAMSAALCVCLAAFGSNVLAQQSAGDASVKAPAVDNTTINQRDKSSATVKATDQPNDSANIHVAASVRKAIVDDKSLSTMAHNVKLVAANGVVTLRGPVDSSGEKFKIGQIAANTSGVSRVDNQLDVKTK